MHILPVVDLSDIPEPPADYQPTPWARRVAWALDWMRTRKRGKAVLVHLEDEPRFREVGPSVSLR